MPQNQTISIYISIISYMHHSPIQKPFCFMYFLFAIFLTPHSLSKVSIYTWATWRVVSLHIRILGHPCIWAFTAILWTSAKTSRSLPDVLSLSDHQQVTYRIDILQSYRHFKSSRRLFYIFAYIAMFSYSYTYAMCLSDGYSFNHEYIAETHTDKNHCYDLRGLQNVPQITLCLTETSFQVQFLITET